MSDLNSVTMSGNATRDADMNFTSTGKAVTKIGFANNVWNGKEEVPQFLTIIVWGNLAEWASKVTKGQPLVVTGEIFNRQYTDREGVKRTTLEITARGLKVFTAKDYLAGRETVPAPDSLGDQDSHPF